MYGVLGVECLCAGGGSGVSGLLHAFGASHCCCNTPLSGRRAVGVRAGAPQLLQLVGIAMAQSDHNIMDTLRLHWLMALVMLSERLAA